MTDNTKQNIYTSSDMATLLKIQESTLRKYCIMLEETGYKFHKNELGHRGFLNNDVIALKRLLEIKKHPDMTLKQACNAVTIWAKESNVTDHNTTDIAKRDEHKESYNTLLHQFKDFQEQQMQFNQELLNQLKQQQEFIETSLKERDQKLTEALRETLETKKMIAAAAEQQQQKNSSFWQRLFNK
jgi:parvulin-like peptidyl-prolyl isomerase